MKKFKSAKETFDGRMNPDQVMLEEFTRTYENLCKMHPEDAGLVIKNMMTLGFLLRPQEEAAGIFIMEMISKMQEVVVMDEETRKEFLNELIKTIWAAGRH